MALVTDIWLVTIASLLDGVYSAYVALSCFGALLAVIYTRLALFVSGVVVAAWAELPTICDNCWFTFVRIDLVRVI